MLVVLTIDKRCSQKYGFDVDKNIVSTLSEAGSIYSADSFSVCMGIYSADAFSWLQKGYVFTLISFWPVLN